MRQHTQSDASKRLHALTVISTALLGELRLLVGHLGDFEREPADYPLSPMLTQMYSAANFCGFWGVGNYLGGLRELAHAIETVPKLSVDPLEFKERVKAVAHGVQALGLFLADMSAGVTVSYGKLNDQFAQVMRKARPQLLELTPEEAAPVLFMPVPPSLDVDAHWSGAVDSNRESLLAVVGAVCADGGLIVANLRALAFANPYRTLSGLFEAAACEHQSLVDRPLGEDFRKELQRLQGLLVRGEPAEPLKPDAFLFSRLLFSLATTKRTDGQTTALRRRYALTTPGSSVTSMHDLACKFAAASTRFQDGYVQASLSLTPSAAARMAGVIAEDAPHLESPAFTAFSESMRAMTAGWLQTPPDSEGWIRGAAYVLLMRESAATWGRQDVQEDLLQLAGHMARGGPVPTCTSMQDSMRVGAVQKACAALQDDFKLLKRGIEDSMRSVGDTDLVPSLAQRVAQTVGDKVHKHLQSVAGVSLCLGLVEAGSFAERAAVDVLTGELWESAARRAKLFDALARMHLFMGRLRPGSLLDMEPEDVGELPAEPVPVAPTAEVPHVAAPPAAASDDTAQVEADDVEPSADETLVTESARLPASFEHDEVPAASLEPEGTLDEDLAGRVEAPCDAAIDAAACVEQALFVESHLADALATADVYVPMELTLDFETVDESVPMLDFGDVDMPDAVSELTPEGLTVEFTAAGSGRHNALDIADAELLNVMFEESWQCMEAIEAALSGAARGEAGVVIEARRHIHTLKGVCRTCGLQKSGALLHAMEDRLDVMPDDGVEFARLLEPFRLTMLDVRAQLEHARSQWRSPAAVERVEAAVPVDPVASTAIDHVVTQSPAAEASAVEPAFSQLSTAPARQRATGTVRIPVQLADSLGANTSKVLTASRRALEDSQKAMRLMRDLEENLRRMAPAIREFELMASASIASTQAQGSALGFDPLEFDRYTQMQEVSRHLSEAYEDVQGSADALSDTLHVSNVHEEDRVVLSDDLQRGSSELLLVPIGSQAARLERVVAMACVDTGKRASLVVEPSAKVPAAALDKLMPVFEHILRNAVAHGVEAPKKRMASGKSADAVITIGAPNAQAGEGGVVSLSVKDDGAGIDLDQVRATAEGRGLVVNAATLSDDAARELLFAPGFSTAGSVSELAGRGVGLDVVRSAVSSLGGVVSVASSLGKGTEFTLTLPTDAASMAVVPVVSGGFKCLLPLTLVRRIVPVSAGAEVVIDAVGGKARIAGVEHDLIDLSQRVPCVRGAARAGRGHLVLMQASNVVKAVLVDSVGKQTRVVVKPLGPYVRDIPGMVAGSISAGGGARLVVNPLQLAPVAAPSGGDRTVASVKRVMVVDDSSTVRLVTSRFLKRCGYGVETARDGLEALQVLSKGAKPDVFLFDLEMPGMGGFELIAEVRRQAQFATTPIVVITSRTAEKHRERAVQVGATEFLAKPYEDAQLQGVLGRLLVQS